MGNLNCYAVVVPGLETVAADELNALAAHDVKVEAGGVSFTTTMDGLFRINLRSRISTRILIRLASFRALSFPELYNKSKKVAWELYIGPQTAVSVRASCSSSKLMHSGRAEQALTDAVHDRLGFETKDAAGEQQILLRVDNNQCTISLDSSGERLDRRGYRIHSGKAPVRETIAAAILHWAQWQNDEPLLCPMCGSGTFAIEAAWLATKRASGLDHIFPFASWPSLKEKRWQRASSKAVAMQHDEQHPCILASDLDAAILTQAKENAAGAGVGDKIQFKRLDVRRLGELRLNELKQDTFKKTGSEHRSGSGLIVCNPPYGDRVKGDIKSLYGSLGVVFRQHFSGWSMAIIVPDQACEKALGLKPMKRIKFKHGGKWVQALYIAG